MTKTTVDDDETGTAPSSVSHALNISPIIFNVVALIFIMQRKDKWYSQRLKLLASMSFPLLLGLNVALF